MADTDKDNLIQQFISITQTDPDRARFYLESSAWNLEVAMSSFWDSNVEEPEDNEGEVNASESHQASDVDVSMPTAGSRNPESNTRVATFSSMTVDSDSSDDEGQAYYAGGSERSGQQVIGPPKKKKDSNRLVDKLFKSAREHGAEEKNDESTSSKPRSTFVGAGYRLGETSDDSTVVQGAKAVERNQQQVDKKLKLWKNGFSINDGELRDYTDPKNQQFLASISKGEVPQELIREAKGGEVNLDMEDHRGEDYIKPKVKVKAFSGAGNMLGSPAPNMTESGASAGDTNNVSPIRLDDSKPVTNVQLRLADGSRQVLKLNHSHTVQDIRNHIVASSPQYAQSTFCLITTFPNKELTDETLTVEDAKLLNAVLVQRLK